MARITGIQWYYQLQCLLFLFLAIYSFVFVSTYSADKCYAIKTTTSSSTNSTVTNSTTLTACPNSTASPTTSYTVVAGILGFVYVAEVVLMIFMILFLYYFSNLDIAEFANLGFCQNCMGKLTKCLPYLVVVGHLIAFILVVAQLFLVFVGKGCSNACHFDTQKQKIEYGAMQSAGEVLIIVCSLCWVLMHVCGGMLRRSVYYDSFFYQPEEKSIKWILWCCIRCGP